MKIKTPNQILDPNQKTSEDLIKQIQNIADDVKGILKGGLSMGDAQLPFQYREVNVTSGQPTFLTIQAPYSIIGAYPIQTYGKVVTGFSTNIGNTYTVTLTFSSTSAQSGKVGFLVVGV